MSTILERVGPKFRCRIAGESTDRMAIPGGHKTRKGSRLRVSAAGKVTYNNPDCYTGDWGPGSRTFKLSKQNPRVQTADQICKSIAEKIEGRDNCNRMTGRPCGRGYYIRATDGHVALLCKGPGTGEPNAVFEHLWDQWKIVAEISDPEFQLAIKRASLMCPESRQIQLFGNRNTITIYSSDPECGDFVGKVPAVIGDFWKCALDWKYLDSVLGVWPLYVSYAGPEKALIFYPQSADWAYVVMPMRMK